MSQTKDACAVAFERLLSQLAGSEQWSQGEKAAYLAFFRHGWSSRGAAQPQTPEHSAPSRNIPAQLSAADQQDVAKIQACAEQEQQAITTYKIQQWLGCGGSKASRLLRIIR